MPAGKPAGVILTGGRSSRMGVRHKALLPFGNTTLLDRVIARLQPQLSSLLLSGPEAISAFDRHGLTIVPDLRPAHRGPLMGLYSAMSRLAGSGMERGLVLCPCDAPFVPADLVSVMLGVASGNLGKVVVISYQGVLQPTFSMWQAGHFAAIHDAIVKRGEGGLKRLLCSIPHTVLKWAPAEPPPFFNVNTPEQLQTACAWLDDTTT